MSADWRIASVSTWLFAISVASRLGIRDARSSATAPAGSRQFAAGSQCHLCKRLALGRPLRSGQSVLAILHAADVQSAGPDANIDSHPTDTPFIELALSAISTFGFLANSLALCQCFFTNQSGHCVGQRECRKLHGVPRRSAGLTTPSILGSMGAVNCHVSPQPPADQQRGTRSAPA